MKTFSRLLAAMLFLCLFTTGYGQSEEVFFYVVVFT